MTPTKLQVTEGGSDGYTVVLRSEPTDDVTVAVKVPAGAEFTVEEEELTFASTVLGKTDADGDGEGRVGTTTRWRRRRSGSSTT